MSAESAPASKKKITKRNVLLGTLLTAASGILATLVNDTYHGWKEENTKLYSRLETLEAQSANFDRVKEHDDRLLHLEQLTGAQAILVDKVLDYHFQHPERPEDPVRVRNENAEVSSRPTLPRTPRPRNPDDFRIQQRPPEVTKVK